MNDETIVSLLWQRDESALRAVADRYEHYLYTIAQRIIGNREDALECINDTYLAAWNTIPPEKPASLSAYLGRIARNLSLHRLRHNRAEKRGGGQPPLPLDELADCIPDTAQWQEEHAAELGQSIDRFLRALPTKERQIFVSRYYHLQEVKRIAGDLAASESRIKMTLLRTRKKLKVHLEKEGFSV